MMVSEGANRTKAACPARTRPNTVSLDVPRTFDDLLHALARFPSFALTFALIAQIWFLQYRFFRRYALHDGITILLNSCCSSSSCSSRIR
jgi:hypothetical protein